jgi:hypothetical protein
VELVNLGPALAKEFLRQAKDPMKPRRWHHEYLALPFHMDRVNSFAQTVDPWQPTDCPIVIISRSRAGAVVWDQTVGHSDRRSIRLQAVGPVERCELPVAGAVCSVRPQHRYRLSGWIKTRGVARFARLELHAYEYNLANVTASWQSPSVAGSRGWTRVSVEMESGDAVYVLPKLVLYGPGTAWFDDVSLERIS